MTVHTRMRSPEQLEDEIRAIIKESGAADLKTLMKRFHLHGDWHAYNYLCRLDSLVWLMGDYAAIPTCCMGEDHEREHDEILWPGEPGAVPNLKAAE